ncbi:MAG: ribosome-associated protein [Lacunisphaera sp.]|jgi:ribosome-associated protein|nr:ribosome-associated protein [Lacunisphaera sp.]MDB6164922.1 ribosome-associated protein [Lacunisphaera sp.]
MNKSNKPRQETNSSSPRHVVVREVPIELCQFIKFGGLTESGGEAKQLISEGLVLLNGVVETQKRKKLAVGDQVKANGHTIVVRLA